MKMDMFIQEWEDFSDGMLGPTAVEYDADLANDTNALTETRIRSLEEMQNLRQHTPPLTYDILSLPQNIAFSIAGTGCAILQVHLKYDESLIN